MLRKAVEREKEQNSLSTLDGANADWRCFKSSPPSPLYAAPSKCTL